MAPLEPEVDWGAVDGEPLSGHAGEEGRIEALVPTRISPGSSCSFIVPWGDLPYLGGEGTSLLLG
jgi:hypothetical protein